ncbi:MAG: GGDEF domain-containing protein [candidate division Zixibacteria bacterium]|nr:GGDEF domain-containing protein [candidate division Zixibacteria bacterium]
MTLSGKIEKLYFGAKGILLAPIVIWMYFYADTVKTLNFTVLLLVYVLINLLLFWMVANRWIKSTSMFFPLVAIDVLFVFFSMAYYGDAAKNLFVIYYFLIGLLSMYRPIGKVVFSACAFSLAYLLSSTISNNAQPLSEALIKVFYIWLTGGIGYIISHFIASSEKRLLKTLDILNERTWELESSQAMLENMYETTRALSTILDLDQLLQDILNIANDLLRVNKCSVILVDSSGKNLNLHAKLEKRVKTICDPPIVISEKKPADIAVYAGEFYNRKAKIGFDSGRRFLELPLISHGKVIGLLQIEPQKKYEFLEKDRKNFTVFANSAAIAIDNARLHMKMQELTIIDGLTGLFNYRYFRTKLLDEIRRSDRYHQKLSILMIDIDHFKAINDSQGHQTGNLILQEIVGIIKHSVRDVDIVARYGGEEFVVILPQTGVENAMVIAERMRAQVESAYFTSAQGQRDIRSTVSAGVAVYPDGMISANQLLEKVDQAMYRAKKDGRNRICVAPMKSKKESTRKIKQ